MNVVTPLHRRLAYAALGVLFLTGCEWTVMDWGGFSLVPDKAEAMQIHGAAAMAALVLAGAMLPAHVPVGWAIRRNRASGAGTLALLALLAITGYLLYYAGGEALRRAASLLHLALGLALAPAFVAHIKTVKGRTP